MRRVDIEPGDYALSTWGRCPLGDPGAHRVRVESNAPVPLRKPSESGRTMVRSGIDGVRVTFVGGFRDGHETIARLQQVIGTWADHVAAQHGRETV